MIKLIQRHSFYKYILYIIYKIIYYKEMILGAYIDD